MIDAAPQFDARLLDLLQCPRDRTPLTRDGDHLACAHGHRYPIVDGVPVFLLAEREQTIGIATESLKAAASGDGAPLYVTTLGLSEEEKRGVARDWSAGGRIDAAISYLVGATSGWGYVESIGRLTHYPIPDIPVGRGDGELLLDIGSNWGRWSVSAARKGWRVIGIEPSLGAIMAARRAFAAKHPDTNRDADLDVAWICGDARFLPFKAAAFQCAFSYSVIQHFSEADAGLAIAEMGRVLRPGGFAKIQMAHRGGLRSTYSRTRPDYLGGGIFRVRYWSLAAMRQAFETHVGPTRLVAEAFGGLGLLTEDRHFVSGKAKLLIAVSALLKKATTLLPGLIRVADSVYAVATKK